MPGPLRLVKTRPTGNGRARGLVSSRESGARIEAQTYAPGDAVRDVVATYWTGAWDLRGQAPHTTELLSDPCVHFVFEHGGPHAGGRIVGVWTRLWRRTLEGKGWVRGVKLRAGAVRAFACLPAFHFTNRITPLSAAFADVAAIARSVLGSEDHAEAFGALEDWLCARRRRSEEEAIQRAVVLTERIARDPEITTVERLAATAGLSPRAAQRLFRTHVGASPKWVIRRSRLQEAAVRIERGEPPTLATLAADLGYTDQAHFARDFKHAVGRGPREFAASVWK